MAERCEKCSLILAARHLQKCEHCGKVMCTTHMLEHWKELEFNYKTVPGIMRMQ